MGSKAAPALSGLVAPAILRADLGCAEPGRAQRSPQCAGGAGQFDGPQHKVWVRLAEHDRLIYLDLADEFWRCIEISANGWRIAEDPPVRFRRSAGMQPLPLPSRGGSVDSLAPFLNLASEDDFVLVVSWLLGPCEQAAPIRSWPSLANKDQRRPSSRTCGR
jgi:hypothetical protein